jgi:hypothetical protein
LARRAEDSAPYLARRTGNLPANPGFALLANGARGATLYLVWGHSQDAPGDCSRLQIFLKFFEGFPMKEGKEQP